MRDEISDQSCRSEHVNYWSRETVSLHTFEAKEPQYDLTVSQEGICICFEVSEIDYSNMLLLLRTVRARGDDDYPAPEALAFHGIARSIRQVVAAYLLLVSHVVDATYNLCILPPAALSSSVLSWG